MTARPVPKGTRKAVAKRTPKRAARGRRDPVIEVQAVDELPDTFHRHNDRATRYARAMAEVRKKRPGWYRIASYESRNGAAEVRRAILRGERLIDGDLSEWDIETRRVRNGAGEIVGSELYVQLVRP